MTFARPLLIRGAATLALCLAAALPARAADASEISRAEKLVFVDKHLINVKTPGSLRYSFVRSGSLEPAFEDEAQLEIKRAGTVCCVVQGSFLSGPRQVKLPEIAEAQSNPVILFFLERDIREMERLTKGKSSYFRKRIRGAMVDQATVRDTKVSYGGHEFSAMEVSLTPYANDPLRERFEQYAQKRYVFLLAPELPGGVYQVRTALPGALPTDAPVQEEILTLVDSADAAASPARKKK